MRSKMYYYIFKKGKQYKFNIPYVTYWGCDNYHWLKIHSQTWIGMEGKRINGDTLITVLLKNGEITFKKP